MKLAIFISSLSLLLGATASADTVIEFKNQQTKSQFLTNGKMARINTRGTDDYMLVNFDKKAIYSITPEKKQIINVSESIPSISGIEPPRIKLNLKAAGKGPAIAGYNTTKYRLHANGEYCGSIFASKEALKGTAIENMFDAMKAMADNHRQSLGGFAAAIPVCQMARMEMADKLREIGAPMRTVDKAGEIDTEITMILKNAPVEAKNYAFPANYETISMGEKIQSVQTENLKMDNMQKNLPEMQRMMREMQHSGQIPPEAMEQMKRYQEMMQQRR